MIGMKSFCHYCRAVACILFVSLSFAYARKGREYERSLTEEERMKEYENRGYEWPIQTFNPNTEGWNHLFHRRIRQLDSIEDLNARYNGWVQTLSAGLIAPNFTANGWGLTRAPTHVVEKLKSILHAGLANATYEGDIEVIEGKNPPLFIPIGNTNDWVLQELKSMHEQWSGVELIGEIAYGLRVYQAGSTLNMHVDRPLTHIISCILHIDHSEDGENWPIIIEDLQGNTNEVKLESGDMLFYESSKCFHGRPKKLTGSWYSSIFVHYYPRGWDTETFDLESHYAVPSRWSDPAIPLNGVDELVVVGTSVKEPGCEHIWCALKNSVKWQGPAIEGKVITTGWKPDEDKNDLGAEL